MNIHRVTSPNTCPLKLRSSGFVISEPSSPSLPAQTQTKSVTLDHHRPGTGFHMGREGPSATFRGEGGLMLQTQDLIQCKFNAPLGQFHPNRFTSGTQEAAPEASKVFH